MNCNLPGSSVHGIFQARVLEWIAIVSSKIAYATAAAKSFQSCLTLCNPIDGSPPGSLIPRILQARTLEWVAISFSNAWKRKVKVKSLSHVWPSDPMDCSPPGSSVHGIFQARVLEWAAIANSILIENSVLFEFFWKECYVLNNCEDKELECGFYWDLIEHLFEWLVKVTQGLLYI